MRPLGCLVDDASAAYVEAQLAHPSFLKWRARSLTKGNTLPGYTRDWPTSDWPTRDWPTRDWPHLI